MFPQTLFINNQLYPSSVRPLRGKDEPNRGVYSYAWACPTCGEVWARAFLPGRPFFFFTHPCEEHEDLLIPSLIVSGSILLPGETSFNSSLPPEAWKRELLLHINFVERNPSVNTTED